MVTQLIPVTPGGFEADYREPLETLAAPGTVPSLTQSGLSMRPDEDYEAPSPQTPSLPCKLSIEREGQLVSLDLPLYADLSEAPEVYRLNTPDGSVEGIELSLWVWPGSQVRMQIYINYTGLGVDRALSLAHFSHALRWERGTFFVSAREGTELRPLVRASLPLPFDPSERETLREELRFWETVHEISHATNTPLFYPQEVTETDLRNIGRVFEAIHKGWYTEQISDFSLPLPPETVKNLVDHVEREGDVLKSFALDFERESYEIFRSMVNVGRCIRYLPEVRLKTSLSEMREWLNNEPDPEASFKTFWVPANDTPLHVLFPEWPKPSLESVRQDLKAFEVEYGMSTVEFRQALAEGEPRARAVEDGDIWLTLSDVEQVLVKKG